MRSNDIANGVALTFCGVVYSGMLFVFAFFAAGAGHGTYLPFTVFGAPLSLLNQQLALFAVLVIWPVGGFILGSSRRLIWPALLLLIHALSVGAILMWGTPYESVQEQQKYFSTARQYIGGSIGTGFLIYAVGQCAAWALLLLRKMSPDDEYESIAG
jgi:hypothetical protein